MSAFLPLLLSLLGNLLAFTSHTVTLGSNLYMVFPFVFILCVFMLMISISVTYVPIPLINAGVPDPTVWQALRMLFLLLGSRRTDSTWGVFSDWCPVIGQVVMDLVPKFNWEGVGFSNETEKI